MNNDTPHAAVDLALRLRRIAEQQKRNAEEAALLAAEYEAVLKLRRASLEAEHGLHIEDLVQYIGDDFALRGRVGKIADLTETTVRLAMQVEGARRIVEVPYAQVNALDPYYYNVLAGVIHASND